MSENSLFFNFAILTNNPRHAHFDRRTLRELGPESVHVFHSARDASDKLGEFNIHVALVDSHLDDMTGRDCVKLLKRINTGRPLPVVMVTQDSRRDNVLDAISAGCSGYVLRPYSPVTFERHINVALNSSSYDEIESEQLSMAQDMVDRGQFDDAIDEFEELVTADNEAQRYFDMGTNYLMKHQYGKAIISFNKAVKLNQLFAEAYKGLADSHKGKGNDEEYKKYMNRAAEVFASQDKLQEAKELFVEILKSDPDAINPYNTLGVELRRKGDFDGAIKAYNQALLLSPQDEHLRYNIAKAYLFVHEKEQAKAHLKTALEINPGFQEAEDMMDRLQGKKVKVRRPKKNTSEAGMRIDT